MGEKSDAERTDAAWDPIVGCSVISPGCENCYAMPAAYQLGQDPRASQYKGLLDTVDSRPVWNGKVRLDRAALDKPLRWHGPRRIFVPSMGDLFHEGVPDLWIDKVLAVMAMAEQHQFHVLTKRASRLHGYFTQLTPSMVEGRLHDMLSDRWFRYMGIDFIEPSPEARKARQDRLHSRGGWPLPNVQLGVSTEDQERAEERIPYLLETPAAVRFIRAEPLLGPIDLEDVLRQGVGASTHVDKAGVERCDLTGERTTVLDRVIVGGELGQGARPLRPDWAEAIRRQCVEAGVAFHVAQWGEAAAYDQQGIPLKEGLPDASEDDGNPRPSG